LQKRGLLQFVTLSGGNQTLGSINAEKSVLASSPRIVASHVSKSLNSLNYAAVASMLRNALLGGLVICLKRFQKKFSRRVGAWLQRVRPRQNHAFADSSAATQILETL
jgi:hypothetical protein